MRKATRAFERTRCTAQWTVRGWSSTENIRTVRCTLIHGHAPYPHSKGLVDWTDESKTHDNYHHPGKPAPPAIDEIECDLHGGRVPCATCCADQLSEAIG